LGLTWEDVRDQYECEVWPDNWQAVMAFVSLETQWRVGMGGAYGLDYGAIPPVLMMKRIPRKDWPDVFEALRVMEDEALRVKDEQDRERERNGR
jgi:hypothetical protein